MMGVYIHIPFCRKICPYCDFYKKRGSIGEDFVKALIREIECSEGGKVDTIFFGGGTPSMLKQEQLEKILYTLHRKFSISDNAEITMESNPEDIYDSNLKIWKELGINRISIGVQTFNSWGLKVLGRWHTVEQCIRSVEKSLEKGFNTNVDIIFGYPGQKLMDLEKDILTLGRLYPNHISAYSLQIEEKTLYHYWFKKGEISLPENLREFYILRDEILNSYGYRRYEISNFAREGYECKHNLKYWLREKYIGFGPSAASFYPERKLRVKNIPSISRYIKEFPPPREYDILGVREEKIERIYLGLRIGKLKYDEAVEMCGYGVLEEIKEFTKINGFIEVKSEYLHVFDKIVEKLILTL